MYDFWKNVATSTNILTFLTYKMYFISCNGYLIWDLNKNNLLKVVITRDSFCKRDRDLEIEEGR